MSQSLIPTKPIPTTRIEPRAQARYRVSMPVRDYQRFIRENLPVAAVPGISEIRLHMAGPASGLGRLSLDAPYFAWPWAGGLALARYLLDDPGRARGRRVADIGAGSGLVGIAAALCGARVTCIESDAAAVAAIGLNAALNGVEIAVDHRDAASGAAPDADLVLAGDVFYAPGVAARMTGFLERCGANGAEVLVGDPGRADLPVARLRRLMSLRVADFGAGGTVEAGIHAFVQGGPAEGALAPTAESTDKAASNTGSRFT
jgi:predicted nicotinamide N-methyase